MNSTASSDRAPITRLLIAAAVAFALMVPIFFVWMLIYDRQQQAEFAAESIAAGWGGPQVMAGPLLVIPYRTTSTETVTRDGVATTREVDVWEQRTFVPETVEITTALRPERRSRSIYEAIVYEAETEGVARFAMPADIQHHGVDPRPARPYAGGIALQPGGSWRVGSQSQRFRRRRAIAAAAGRWGVSRLFRLAQRGVACGRTSGCAVLLRVSGQRVAGAVAEGGGHTLDDNLLLAPPLLSGWVAAGGS
jgi:hypothetical protein